MSYVSCCVSLFCVVVLCTIALKSHGSLFSGFVRVFCCVLCWAFVFVGVSCLVALCWTFVFVVELCFCVAKDIAHCVA